MQGEGHSRTALPVGTVVNGVYSIEAEVGHGGFGIVCKACHREIGLLVAIKEYFPIELAVRANGAVHPRNAGCQGHFDDGLWRFLEEAKQLIEFEDCRNVVSCRDFFRGNGTAYMVMEFEDGMPLSELLVAREAEGRPFDEAEMLAVMVPLLEGLEAVHAAGVLHRDIKPSNIIIRQTASHEYERPVLIDFGAAKVSVAEHSKSFAPYTDGYAAIEQVGEGSLGPWTDLYAVGAVMWRIVAGGNAMYKRPNPVKVESRAGQMAQGWHDPLSRAQEVGAGRFSDEILGAVDKCLKLHQSDRVQDCADLLGLLRLAQGPPVASQPAVRDRYGEDPISKTSLSKLEQLLKTGSSPVHWMWAGLGIATVVVLMAFFAMPERAEEELDAVEQFNRGRAYALGEGAEQDDAEAAQWYRRAAEQGHAEAQEALGTMYLRGEGVEQDDVEAARWCRRAAEQGHVMAIFDLCLMYGVGRGVEQDDAEAERWYRRFAVHPNSLMSSVRDVELDYSEPVRWWRRAAKKGHAEAQWVMGRLYLQAELVEQDDAEAAQWYRRAAEQGHAEAQQDLGLVYIGGRGVPANRVLAHMWLNISGANGFDSSRSMRQLLEPKMSAAELSRAQELARVCVSSGYSQCD